MIYKIGLVQCVKRSPELKDGHFYFQLSLQEIIKRSNTIRPCNTEVLRDVKDGIILFELSFSSQIEKGE